MKFSNTPLPDIVELKNIRQSYDNGKTFIIDDFNLLIEDLPGTGQFVIILGASGCGKSTILRYISGLQTPTKGEILINGKPITPDDRVSMVFQQYSSFPWLTVLENVALGLEYKGISKKERNKQAMEMIKVVGLTGHEKKFAKHPVLSGGQLQRVAIARSLLTNDQILLLDEPFGALDVNTRLKMQDFLMDIWTKVHPTIILVTHDISEAVYLGDVIYLMSSRPGKIAHQVKVNLPFPREKKIKRTKEFIDTVNQIEDLMVQLQN